MKTTYTSTFKAQVVLELLKEEKTISQVAAEYKVHPNVLRDWRTLAIKNLAALFDKHDDVGSLRIAYEQQLEDLYAQLGRLTSQLTWIKKKLALTLTRAERRALIEVEQQDVSLTAQAHILSLSRSSLYYRSAPPSASELAAKHRIDELYLEFPYYGARRMAA